jgi:hypothetical protein
MAKRTKENAPPAALISNTTFVERSLDLARRSKRESPNMMILIVVKSIDKK